MIKKVLITGASSGIGEALSYEYSKLGFDVILVARSKDKLVKVAQKCKIHKTNPIVLDADLSLESEVYRIFKYLKDNNISVDILCNNAGFGDYNHFSEMNQSKLLQMIQVNITSLSLLTYLIIPQMKSKNSGQIIFIGSIFSYLPVPKYAIYAATKAFVRSLSLAIKSELSKTNIQVSCVCPGSTLTKFHEVAGVKGVSKMFSATPEEIARYIIRKLPKGIIIPKWYNKLFVVLSVIFTSISMSGISLFLKNL